MIRFAVQRILLLLPLLLIVSLISFLLFSLAPGDPAEILLTGPQGGVDPDAVEEFRKRAGLDEPSYILYLRWLKRALSLDLGRSLATGERVTDAIMEAFWPTLKLSLSSLAVSLLISLPLGTISAVRRGTCLDSLGMAIAMLGISVPNFWLAYLLIMLFSLHLDLLPVAGFGSGGDLEHTLLPALTLGLAASAVTNRVVRASMVEALSQDYTMAAIARGLPRRSVVLRHAMRNALLPIITVIGLNFSYLINGSAVVEAIFAWPGMGNLMVRSIYDRDYPLILGCMLFVALLMLILNLAVDLCCYYLNPRLRYAREN